MMNFLYAHASSAKGSEDVIKDTLETVTDKNIWLNINWNALLYRLAVFCLLFFLGILLIKITKKFLKTLLKKQGIRPSVSHFILSATNFLLSFILIIVLANHLGFETTSLIAILGSAGIAIGLALQGSLSNLAYGILIVLLKPIRYGDYIYIGSEKELLKVQDIRLFNTSFLTTRNMTVILPNKNIMQEKIINLSLQDKVRVETLFSVSYTTDLKKVRHIVEKVLQNDPRIFQEDGIQVAVIELADSGINMFARGYVHVQDYISTSFDLRENIKIALDQAGIEIPFPQLEVKIINK